MCKLKNLYTILIFFTLSSIQAEQAEPLSPPSSIAASANIAESKALDLLVDPTQPMEISKPNKKLGANANKIRIRSFDVQIISYNPNGGSFVVINGKRFIEGDVFDETTIKKIEKNKVILSNPTRKPLVLEYANLSIKKSEGRTP